MPGVALLKKNDYKSIRAGPKSITLKQIKFLHQLMWARLDASGAVWVMKTIIATKENERNVIEVKVYVQWIIMDAYTHP